MAKRYTAEEASEIMLKNNLKPITPYANTKVPWKCRCLLCNKIVEPRLQKVLLRGHQCKYCSGHIVDPVDAVKLMKERGFIPQEKYPGANSPWTCKCKNCKKIFNVNYTSVKLGFGCKFCSHRAVDPKDAIASMKKRGFKPLEHFPGASQNWKVECLNCGKIFNTKFHSLNTQNRCKYCSGVAVDKEDLLLRLKKIGLLPLEDYKSAKTPWKCKCLECGKTVQPTWMRIKSGRGHCAYCSQRRVDTKEAIKLLKQIKLKPLVSFPGSNKPWKCLCLNCNSIVNPRWSGLTRGQGGCSNCADYGLNYTKSGYLYLIKNEKLTALKVGIGNSYKGKESDDRITRHLKKDWVLVEKIEFEKLYIAYKLEQNLLKWIREQLNLEIFLQPKDMPQGGWTETFDSRMIDLDIVKDKMRKEVLSMRRRSSRND